VYVVSQSLAESSIDSMLIELVQTRVSHQRLRVLPRRACFQTSRVSELTALRLG
jgi:hypothetical protein